LTGNLPDLISLTRLQTLDLSDNDLTGNLVAARLPTSLAGLHLANNHLEGNIPNLSRFTNVMFLTLSGNRFSGSFPNLPPVRSLLDFDFSNNQLSGEIPASFLNFSTSICGVNYNALTATDPALITRLNWCSQSWDITQTVPVTDLHVVDSTPTSVELGWTPIVYTGDGGFYEVSYSTGLGGPWTVIYQTADKLTTGCAITGLDAGQSYYFRVRTQTFAHDVQQNNVWSDYVMVSLNTRLLTITEQELFTQLQAEIAANPRINHIALTLVDFLPGTIHATVVMTDGTTVDVMIVIHTTPGHVLFEFGDITVGGLPAPDGHRGVIYSEFMPLLTDSLDALLAQEVGAGYQLEALTITDTEIIIDAALP